MKWRQKTAPLWAVVGVLSNRHPKSLHGQASSILFSGGGPILAPRTSDPKMNFSPSLVGHGSCQYMGLCPPSVHRPMIVLAFLTRPPSSSSLGVYSLFPAEPSHSIMSEVPLQPRPVSLHWTVAVSREETLAVRERRLKGLVWRCTEPSAQNQPRSWHAVGQESLGARYLTPGRKRSFGAQVL